ncbi:MAG: hypothetical protein ACOYXC_02945 [Candidatus Rifleibacteriota bacterium]
MKKLLLLLLPLITLAYWYFFERFIPPPPLEISARTTWFTDLEVIDGRVNLGPSFNRKFGLNPEENAIIELLQIFGGVATSPSEVEEFCSLLGVTPELFASTTLFLPVKIDEDGFSTQFRLSATHNNYYQKPWKDDDCPELAAIIAANRATFALVRKMAGKTGSFWPVTSGKSVWSAYVPQEINSSQLIRLQLARGMNYLANSEYDKALDDFVAAGLAGKTAINSTQMIFSLIELLGIKDSLFCVHQLLCRPDLPTELLQQVFHRIDPLTDLSAINKAVEADFRLSQLSLFLEEMPGQKTMLNQSGNSVDLPIDFDLYFDKNVFCRKINDPADVMVRAFGLSSIQERLKALNDFRAKMREQNHGYSSFSLIADLLMARYLTLSSQKCTRVSEILSDIILAVGRPDSIAIIHESLAISENAKLLRLAALILQHRSKSGSLPRQLTDIAIDNPDFITDSFSGKPYFYETGSQSLKIYSIGPDLRDDHGISSDQIDHSDIVLIIPTN